ncbi:MAG TPA: beta-eliminating lyase-related protein [Rhizomicrobium sp.]|nr:beta-eliminating lyase-related protein [Rhizomicrobium sp.]
MNFTSDNCCGASPEILAAVAKANEGTVASYGEDAITERLRDLFSRLFEREVAVFPVISGTAANALALASLVPQHGAIFCHAESHIEVDECGAVEFHTHGARLVSLPGSNGKLAPQTLAEALAPIQKGSPHHAQPAAVSLTQPTERGAVYLPDEIAAIAKVARAAGMRVHMDGARFANAVARLGASPAELTWRAGVDALSFGATKNGALGAEAVVFFDPKDARDFEYRRKKAGHLISKLRFVSAQLQAYLTDDLWLTNAARANALAERLAAGLSARGVEIAGPVDANAVFAILTEPAAARLRAAGAQFYDWAPAGAGRALVRLVTSFATRQDDVDAFVALAGP